MAQGVVAEVVAAVEDAAGDVRVLVQPGADGEDGDPGARLLRLAEKRLRHGGVALAVEGEGHSGRVGAGAVGDLGGSAGVAAGAGASAEVPRVAVAGGALGAAGGVVRSWGRNAARGAEQPVAAPAARVPAVSASPVSRAARRGGAGAAGSSADVVTGPFKGESAEKPAIGPTGWWCGSPRGVRVRAVRGARPRGGAAPSVWINRPGPRRPDRRPETERRPRGRPRRPHGRNGAGGRKRVSGRRRAFRTRWSCRGAAGRHPSGRRACRRGRGPGRSGPAPGPA